MSSDKPERPTSSSTLLPRHVFELTVLNEIGAICASSRSIDDILSRATRLIAHSLFPDNCGFLLLDADRNVLVPHASFVLTVPEVIHADIPLSSGLTGKTARTGQPWRVADVRLDPDYLASDSRTRAELCLPLRVGGEVRGVMNIESSQPNAFSEADERLMIAALDLVGATLERLHHQEQLQASEARHRRMLESLPIGVFVHDGQRMYYANPMAMNIMGVDTVDRLYQMLPMEIIVPAYREMAAQRIETLLRTKGQLPSVEAQICRLDGTIVDVEVYSHWTEYEGRDCVQVHFTEITHRKQVEQELRVSERRLRDLADAIPQIVWIAGADGGLTHLNAKASEYTGIGVDQLTGWSWDQVIHPEDLEATVALWMTCLSDGIPRDIEFRIRRVDQTYRWHITRQVPVRDVSGNIVSWYGTCTDIEELKRAKESLQENELKFRLLFEGAADAIFWADAETGLLTHCNRAAETLLGRDRTEMIGQSQSFLHPPEEIDRYRQLFGEHARSQSSTPVEVQVVHKDGHRIDVAISPSVTQFDGQRVIQGIFRDITERKRAERTIQKLSHFRETIIRTAAEGICVCHAVPDFPFVAFSVWNDRMTEITGYTLEEINRLGWYQSLYPDPNLQARAQERMARMRFGDDLHAEEWEITRRDGQQRTVTISTSTVEIDGDIPAVAALIQDVTEQHRTIQALQQSERSLQLFHALMNLTDDAIHVINPATSQYLEFNERACARLGYTREELQRMGVVDISDVFPDQLAWGEHVQRVKAAGSMTLEGNHHHRDGSTFPVEVNVRFVTLDQREYMVSVARDITERRQTDAIRQRALDSLRRSEERFSKLFHASPFSIIVASYPEGRIIEANAAFLRIFEFTREEVIGRTTGELAIWVLPEDRQRMLDSVRTQGAARNMEYLFQSKSGRRRTLVMSVEIIRLDDQDYSLAMSIDVTDRKAAEAELRKTDELLRAVVQSTSDAVFVKDRQGKYLLFNEAAGKFVGLPHAEVIGKDDTAFFDEAAVKIVQAHDRKVIETGIVSIAEETLTAAGITRTYLATKTPYRDAAGNVIGVIGISHDISDRKRAEQTVRESEERYRKLFETCADAIFILDIHGTIRSLNPAAATMHGCTPDELIGRRMQELDVPADAEQVPNRMKRILTGETLNFEVVHRRKDGTTFPVDVVATLMHVAGEPLVLAFDRDITERKLTEDSLRQSLSRMQATLDATADGILVVDLEGRIIDLNHQFLSVWRFPNRMIATGQKEDLISNFNQHPLIVEMLGQLRDPDAFVQRVREIYESPTESSFDVIEFRDGRTFERLSKPQLMSGVPVGRVWSFRDVTAQLQLEQQLRQSQKMEAIGQLAGGVAHDFNNLLTVINGYCDLLLAKNAEQNPWSESVTEIRDAGRRAARLTEQLLSFSRKSMMSLQVVQINAVIVDTEKLLRRMIGPRVELHLELDPEAGNIRADVMQLEQVLMNLVVNAKDAMPEGGRITLSTRVSSATLIPVSDAVVPISTQYAVMTVSDTGLGMTAEQCSRIFEPFYTTKDVGKGSGLGLAVVHGIVRQHGGQIQVESQPGQGTTFTVVFPRVDNVPANTRTSDLASDEGGTETILLVEDEQGVRRVTRQTLEILGYHVLEASSGDEALRIASEYGDAIDLLLTDVVMPGMSGRQVADALRKDRHELPVLFISGYHEEEGVHAVSNQANESFLKKPFTPQQLTHAIRRCLDAAGKSQ